MSAADLDLTEAVETAARDHYDRERVNGLTGERDGPGWEDVPAIYKHAWRETVLPTVEAAAPVIAAQVAEHIAQAIAAERINRTGHVPWEQGMSDAARIAREHRGDAL